MPPATHLPHNDPPEKQPMGPLFGAAIVIILLAFGALYFWGAHLNQQDENTYPLIPGNATTTE